jgi:hypothetical protein
MHNLRNPAAPTAPASHSSCVVLGLRRALCNCWFAPSSQELPTDLSAEEQAFINMLNEVRQHSSSSSSSSTTLFGCVLHLHMLKTADLQLTWQCPVQDTSQGLQEPSVQHEGCDLQPSSTAVQRGHAVSVSLHTLPHCCCTR